MYIYKTIHQAATTTFNLPIKLNMTDMGCDYIERFNLMFEDSTT